MKKGVFLTLLLCLCLSISGCGQNENAAVPKDPAESPALSAKPKGAITICEKIDESSCLLLFDERVQHDLTAPPAHNYTFCSFHPAEDQISVLAQLKSDSAIYENYSPATMAGNTLYFHSGNGLQLLHENKNHWEIHAVPELENQLCSVSPDGNLFAVIADNSVVVYDKKQDSRTIVLQEIPNALDLFWDTQSHQLAVTYMNGTAVAVWSEKDNQTFYYFADGDSGMNYELALITAAQKLGVRARQIDAMMDLGFDLDEISAMSKEKVHQILMADLDAASREAYEAEKDLPGSPAPEGWVQIVGARPFENNLLIEYLCEEDTVWVIWDMNENRQHNQVRIAGDVIILDVSGNQILYTVEDAGAPSLQIYDTVTEENRTIAEGDGCYTAGCFLSDTTVVVGIYNADTAQSELKVIS